MANTNLQKLDFQGEGFQPLLIRSGWQVAQLNFMPLLQAEAIRRVECHASTDEVFILFKGASVLITATETADSLTFQAEHMQPGVTYNVPAKLWHNIAMMPGDLVIIVENDNTHLNDVCYRNLSASEFEALQACLAQLKT